MNALSKGDKVMVKLQGVKLSNKILTVEGGKRGIILLSYEGEPSFYSDGFYRFSLENLRKLTKLEIALK